MSTVARITKTSCTCGFRGELLFCVEDNWQRPCPDCEKPIAPGGVGTVRYHGNRRFAGSESLSIVEGCHPAEVPRARSLMPSVAHCIKDDGSVEFSDRAEQVKYRKELGRVNPDAVKTVKELGLA